jgi:subtilisin family serine protease
MSHYSVAAVARPRRETPDARGDADVHMPLTKQSGMPLPTRLLLAVMAAVVGFGVLPVGSDAPVPVANAQEAGGEEVIVVLDEGDDPVVVAEELGVELTHVYDEVFTGFAGTLPADAVTEAASARSVQRIFLDGPVQLEAQTIPTGVRRAGVPVEEGENRLGVDSPVNADIAILDTGVTRHADLKVAGGKDCVDPKKKNKKKKKGKKGKGNKDKQSKKQKRKERRQNKRTKPWEDGNGHGTHTAGIAAAIDNDSSVVGVAPGARIWAVKVLGDDGLGTFGDVICGLNWVMQRRDTIDVVNLSLGADGSDGACTNSPFHRAICNVVDAGIPVVVAAGNQFTSASTRIPAAYDEVITVSALADTDGSAGGNGGACAGQSDDTLARFSNDGADVDIMAPGVCILSLSNRGNPVRISGTSEATPHVTGAAAHFIAQELEANGVRPTPQQTKTWLETGGSRSQTEDGVTGDTDGIPEPVLWLEALDEP